MLHMVPNQLDGRPVQHGSLVQGAVHRHSIHLQVQVTTGRATGWRLCRRAPDGPGPPQEIPTLAGWLLVNTFTFLRRFHPPPPHSLVYNPRDLTNPETCSYIRINTSGIRHLNCSFKEKKKNKIFIYTVAPSLVEVNEHIACNHAVLIQGLTT